MIFPEYRLVTLTRATILLRFRRDYDRMCREFFCSGALIMTDTITRVVTWSAPIERVWQMLTEPDYLVHWMCSAVAPFRLVPGELIWFTWDDDRFRARIVAVEPPRLFVWEWYPGSGEDLAKSLEDQGPLTTVTFALDEVEGGTRLTLTETGFAALSPDRQRRSVEVHDPTRT